MITAAVRMPRAQEIILRDHIIEACSPVERTAVDAVFEAFSQHALTWFLIGKELEKVPRTD